MNETMQQPGHRKRDLSRPKGRGVDTDAVHDISQVINTTQPRRDELIEYLHCIQDKWGHISTRHVAALAKVMRLSQTEIFEVATFYAHFDIIAENQTPPPSLTVRVCNSIVCEMAGSADLLESIDYLQASGIRIQRVPCVGACHKAPVAVVGMNRLYHANKNSISEAIAKDQRKPTLPVYPGLNAYLENDGYSRLVSIKTGQLSRAAVLKELESSGLRGLGGAGFDLVRKLRLLEGTPEPRVVVVNADEGEPGTFKDHHCFATNPHQVIEGALIAAAVAQADDLYIYLRDEYSDIRAVLETEIQKLESSDIDIGCRIHLRRGAGAYIVGEESALLESIEGKRGLPRNRPPFPTTAGLFGRPTLINNVETLYWVPEILAKGGEWYAQAGRPHFYSVSGRVKQPGIKLAPAGVTLQQLIDEHCGGMAEGHTLKAYLPGGASGGLLPADKADLPLDFGSLEQYGCFIGSSAIIVLSDQDEIPRTVTNLMRFFEHESCGQCTPCRVGCEKMLGLIDKDVVAWDQELIAELAEAMQDASICGLGQAAPNPVLSVLRFFGRSDK